MIAIGAASIYFAASSVFAEEIEEDTNTILNFNQQVFDTYTHNADFNYNINVADLGGSNSSHKYYVKISYTATESGYIDLYIGNYGIGRRFTPGNSDIIDTYGSNNTYVDLRPQYTNDVKHINYFMIIDLTQMFGENVANNITLEQCRNYFKTDYYNYTLGTAIDLSGFEQYNSGAMNARQSMTINTTSANIADNLDNVVINSSYGSSNKALIQGFMVWGTQDQYTNCTALFNLETNFNEGDYFVFEFYTITGADSINLPNISTFYDLQIVAVDSSGNIVPLATVKAQDSSSTTSKATFYLPFSTDKLYITTPHKYIIGYNNFKISITTTNLTALSLYSYKDGYKAGMSAGYTNGYNNGINGNNAAITSMDYIKSAFTTLGDILTIQVFPNVPLGTFFLLPLMASLIFFIVKVSKGG